MVLSMLKLGRVWMNFTFYIVVYEFVQDLHLFVIGGENEIILASRHLEKREVLENLDLIFLCLDEIVDRGNSPYIPPPMPLFFVSIVG
ncbi:hypothetical protein GQ457_02G015320 [Hibiscus cannabinus]